MIDAAPGIRGQRHALTHKRKFIECEKNAKMVSRKVLRRLWITQCQYLAILILGVTYATPAMAANVPWANSTVTYSSKGKSLGRVLKDILATQPFPSVISSEVRGEVFGQFNDPAKTVFDSLESAYGFIWYFDGSVMYITPSTDARSEIVSTAPMPASHAMQTLSQLGLIEDRFPIRFSGSSVLVSGPSRYVDLVIKALNAEREHAAALRVGQSSGSPSAPRAALASDRMQIRVFPLKYAQAQDMIRTVGAGRYTIPGVATTLKNLLRGVRPVPPVQGEAGSSGRDLTRALDHNPSRSPDVAVGLGERISEESLASHAMASRGDSDGVHIEADIRTNSVVIYDRPEMMGYYASAIASLDRPQKLVQLDVTIVDIVSSDARDLGIDFGIKAPRFRGAIGAPIETAGGITFQGVLGNSVKQVTARLSALETQGRARILSRPKVLTFDNTEAMIGNQSTAYVRVAGAYNTDLYPISAGLQISVTPQVISAKDDQDRVRLSLNITDGNFTPDASIEGIPYANQKYIATQAVVGDGQTLLVGGYQFESENHDLSGVPILSHAPVVGALFRNTKNKHDQTERLFLITPRVVPGDQDDSDVLHRAFSIRGQKLQFGDDSISTDAWSPSSIKPDIAPKKAPSSDTIWLDMNGLHER